MAWLDFTLFAEKTREICNRAMEGETILVEWAYHGSSREGLHLHKVVVDAAADDDLGCGFPPCEMINEAEAPDSESLFEFRSVHR